MYGQLRDQVEKSLHVVSEYGRGRMYNSTHSYLTQGRHKNISNQLLYVYKIIKEVMKGK